MQNTTVKIADFRNAISNVKSMFDVLYYERDVEGASCREFVTGLIDLTLAVEGLKEKLSVIESRKGFNFSAEITESKAIIAEIESVLPLLIEKESEKSEKSKDVKEEVSVHQQVKCEEAILFHYSVQNGFYVKVSGDMTCRTIKDKTKLEYLESRDLWFLRGTKGKPLSEEIWSRIEIFCNKMRGVGVKVYFDRETLDAYSNRNKCKKLA